MVYSGYSNIQRLELDFAMFIGVAQFRFGKSTTCTRHLFSQSEIACQLLGIFAKVFWLFTNESGFAIDDQLAKVMTDGHGLNGAGHHGFNGGSSP